MASKIKGLQQWCKRMTDGYRGVDVRDFTVSWRDGLAFCALIHKFRPDLIDFDSLSKENVFDNNHLAFTVAEKELDIPAFLEASDMVALKTPDKLSIITYVSQYYNKLGSLPQLGGPGVQGKTTPVAPAGVKRHQKPEPLSEPEPKKVPPSDATKDSKTSTLGDKCKICGNKVYLLERHVEGGQLYHRSCYRHSDLSPTNKVYTRSPFFSPSLHGKDEKTTSTPKSPAEVISLNKPADLSRTYDLDNKHVSEVQETSHTDNKKTGPQRFLFPDKEKTSSSIESRKFEAKDSKHQAGDGYLSKDIHRPSDLKLSTSASSTEKNETKSEKKVTATPTFDARTFEKHSVDFLSPEKDAKDVKTPKRQLPLIFQSPDSANDSSSGTSTKPAPVAVDTSAVQKDSGLKSTLPINKGTGEKSTGPVAKPRNFVKKVEEEKMDTTETVHIRERYAVPKPTPRAAVTSQDLTHKKNTPPSARKNAPRPKSPAKDLSPESTSPPPLPFTAPPPLPLSEPPSSSHLPSSRHPPSSHPPKHEPVVHPGSTARDVHTVQKSSHSAAPAKTSSASVSTATASSSNNKVPALARPLSGLTSVSHPPMTVHNATSDVTAAPHPPRTLHTSSHTTTIGASSGGGSHSTVVQPKPAQAVFSISTDVRKEEPMDIDTAVSKARAQYGEEPVAVMVTPSNKGEREKATKTGLLHSLANVRHTSSSSPSAESGKKSTVSITINTTTMHTTLSASADKTSGKSHTSGASHTKTTTATGFVSSKMNQFQTKENESKTGVESALKPKLHNEHGDSSAHKHTLHKAGSSAISTTTTTKVHKTRNDIKVSDHKVHDLGTPSTALKLDKMLDKPPSSVLANVELRAPQRNGKGTHFDSTDERMQSTLSSSVARRDRSKSAADVLGIKELSAKKETTSSEAPAFLQVKLRNANTTGEKKERPKSVGSLLETEDDSSKPVWQMEAERRMAAFRDTGFVDPETKKVSGGGDDRNTQQEISKPLKNGTGNEQPSVIVPQKVTTDFSHGDEGADTKTALHSKTEIVKVPQKSQIQMTIGKPAVSGTETEKGTKVSHRIKVLPTIIKPGQVTAERLHTNEEDKAAPGRDLPPVKPERTHKRAVEEKTVEPKPRSYVSEVTIKDKVPPQAPAEIESQRVLKKLTLGALKDDHTPPRRPSSPPKQPRKKISVDVSFNFNTNNAGSSPAKEAPSVTTVVTPVIKHTPPPRPPPPRASISPGRLSAIELQQQLLDIDSKLTELELRGRQLEDSIRSVDTGEAEDDMMVEWFQLVTDKNELVRQETDLVYMTRETELEDEQSQIENQLRYLLSKEESEKSFEEQKEEEYLIQRKLDIVNQRNCIVDSIDEDRLRYEEEDRGIAEMLQSKGSSPLTCMSKDSLGYLMNEKGKKVAASTFYT